MAILSCILAFVGFISLSLTMKNHYKKIISGSVPGQKAMPKHQALFFRAIASGFLIMSLSASIISCGVAIGLVQWLGILTLAALQASFFLAYLSHWLLVFIRSSESEAVVRSGGGRINTASTI